MNTLEKIKKRTKEEFPKEYVCHILFVYDVAIDLYKRKGGDKEIIEISSIAHDIGRVADGDNSLHPEIGSEKMIPWLKELDYDERKIPAIRGAS